MNIFIIHSGDNWEKAQSVKEEISSKSKKAHVLLLKYRRCFWKKEAVKLMKSANMVLYVMSDNSHTRKNVDWELKTALKTHKNIVLFRERPFEINEILKVKDPFTQEDMIIADEVKSVDEIISIVDDYETKKDINTCLFNGKDFIDNNEDTIQLFEQYKLFTQTSEELVNRRQNVNSFYITANTALITVAATVFAMTGKIEILYLLIIIILSVPGILLNSSWKKILEAYGITNSSKLSIISMLEKRLEASIYDAEWVAMSNKYNLKKYVSFTESEKQIPQIFIVFYSVIDLLCVIGIVVLYFLK